MAMLRGCAFPDRATLTLSERCAAHEKPMPEQVWLRGRPFPRTPSRGQDLARTVDPVAPEPVLPCKTDSRFVAIERW